jgi:hypothetical protein
MQVCPILDKEAKSSRSPPVIPDLIGNTSNQPRLTYHPRNTIHGFSPTPSRCKSGSSRGHIVVPDLIGNTSKPTSPHLSSPKYDSWILSHSIPMQIGIQPRTHCRSRKSGNPANEPRLTYHPRNTIHGFSPTPSRCKLVPYLIGERDPVAAPQLSFPQKRESSKPILP